MAEIELIEPLNLYTSQQMKTDNFHEFVLFNVQQKLKLSSAPNFCFKC